MSWRVDQVRQHRTPADPIRGHMVQHEHQGEAAIGKTGDKHRRPQRRGQPQPGPDHRDGGVQQRLFVARIRAPNGADGPPISDWGSSTQTGPPQPNGARISR